MVGGVRLEDFGPPQPSSPQDFTVLGALLFWRSIGGPAIVRELCGFQKQPVDASGVLPGLAGRGLAEPILGDPHTTSDASIRRLLAHTPTLDPERTCQEAS